MIEKCILTNFFGSDLKSPVTEVTLIEMSSFCSHKFVTFRVINIADSDCGTYNSSSTMFVSRRIMIVISKMEN